jgi:hypothetical protein
MAPALAVVGIFAFLSVWNEYLYPFILLSSPGNKTVAITFPTVFDNEHTPWNYPVAASPIYALPPIALFFAIRRYIAAGLTSGDALHDKERRGGLPHTGALPDHAEDTTNLVSVVPHGLGLCYTRCEPNVVGC